MTTQTSAEAAAGFAEALENTEALDPLRSFYQRLAHALPEGRLLAELRGRSLGHALHPLLTDLPLGSWLSATLLDLTGGRRFEDASRRLVGAGVLFAAPTALSGLADLGRVHSPEAERVGAMHAALNGVAVVGYLTSWSLRRRGRHAAGVTVSLVAGGLVSLSGYLGGHLTLRRGEPEVPTVDAAASAAAASAAADSSDW